MSRLRALAAPALAALLGCQGEAPAPVVARDPAAVQPTTATTDSPPAGRLPRDVIPTRYRLALEIVPERERFSGAVSIDVALERPLEAIWMHGQEFEVESAEFIPVAGRAIPGRFEQVADDGLARLELSEEIGPGSGQIRIRYDAPFNRQLEGVYRVDEGGASYAFTQMEPVSARLAFPSFDEPAFKTPYEIEITTRTEYGAYANTRELRSEDLGDGLKRVVFAPTENLPTYLIAFAVGPLDVVEATVPPTAIRADPLALRGLAARGKGDQLGYALRHTAAMLEVLESYFATPYPFDKLDLVAAPDFSAGAMENAGLVIYRESLLLLDEDAPLSQQRRFATVHAHELAHQWFGNLVTMPWWDDIWLNEAFATWMAHKTVHAWRPEYHSDRNVLAGALRAMSTDSLDSTRRIREPVETGHDILSAFDGITYSKGGGVLAMFETYLGEDVFREGMRRHMREHAFGSADVFDFIRSLESVAGADKNISRAFESFLFQPGVPFVAVALDCAGEDARVTLSQSRYLPLGSTAEGGQTWEVPVCLSYGVDEQVREDCFMLDGAERTFPLGSALTCPDWIMPNRDGAGYYRWGLPADQWAGLSRVANERLNAREKIAFADSLLAAFANASLKTGQLLGALPELIRAPERPVATAPLPVLERIIEHLVEPANRTRARAFARELYRERMAALEAGAGAESVDEARLLRAELIEFLTLDAASEELRAELLDAAKSYLGLGGDGELDPSALDPELLDLAMIVAGQEADAAMYQHLLEHLSGSTSALVRRALLAGLGRVHDPQLRDRSLALIMDPSLRVNELPVLISSLMEPPNRDASWAWIRANADALIERFPPAYRRLMPWVGLDFCAREEAAALTALFEPHLERMPGAPRTLAQVTERINLCAELKARQGPSANRFFAEWDLHPG